MVVPVNMSPLSFSSEKVISSESGEKYAHCYKPNSFKTSILLIGKNSWWWDFSLLKAIHGLWIEYLKNAFLMDWITCGLLWLSFWRHPFTAEDPLVNKWCNDTFCAKKLFWQDLWTEQQQMMDVVFFCCCSRFFINV